MSAPPYANVTAGFFDHLSSVFSPTCNTTINTIYNGHFEDSDSAMHNVLFHLANVCFLLSYLSPNTRFGQVALHGGLILGFLVLSTWAWNVICAPDVFAWYFGFTLLNVGQLLYILYQMRPIRFDDDLEAAYADLFEPMTITRAQFKRLVGGGSMLTSDEVTQSGGQIVSLHSGECYAIQDMTRTDRLALLISGRVNVLNERTFLHSIGPCEFLDSPEFESSGPKWADTTAAETTFKVTVCAAVPSRCVVWTRASLEYLFVKDPHLATVMATVISRDITHKLLAMNAKLKTASGNPLDLRLPGIAGRLSEMDARELAKFTAMANNNEEQLRKAAAASDRTRKASRKKATLDRPGSIFGKQRPNHRPE